MKLSVLSLTGMKYISFETHLVETMIRSTLSNKQSIFFWMMIIFPRPLFLLNNVLVADKFQNEVCRKESCRIQASTNSK